jgi:hypothetical protein
MLRKITTKLDTTSIGIKRYFIFTWIIGLVAFCSIYHALSDMRQLRPVVDGDRSSAEIDSWIEIPTVTVTSTVYDKTETQRWISEASSAPLWTTSSSLVFPEAHRMDHSPIMTSSATSTLHTISAQTAKQTPTYKYPDTPKSSLSIQVQQSILERYGLMPVDNLFSFTWPDEYADSLKRTLAKVVGTMEVVWNIFRKVYHYPLDPP